MNEKSPGTDAASADKDLTLSLDGAIATITLNIPQKHNALNGDNIQLFCDYMDRVEQAPAIRVLIITGAGEKTFCAGAALDQLGSGAIDGNLFTDMTDKLANLSIPTIAALNGSAYGGGSEIGLACDFRIGVNGMRVFVPPARIGLCYPVNGIERFVQTLGVNAAKRLLLASEEFSAEALLSIGYLTSLVERENLDTEAQTLARRMAGYAPLSLRAMKTICQQVATGTLDKTEAQKIAEACNNSEDLQEGLSANKEKRPPLFKGK